MSTIIDKLNNSSQKIGMLFLFDIVNSSKLVSKSDTLSDNIFYDKIRLITKNVVQELNRKYSYDIEIAQSTGDGYYFFCNDPVCCLDLWIMLCHYFNNEKITIRCGASYGYVNINEENIGSKLANIVDRCCNYSNNENRLIITSNLYSLVKDSSLFVLKKTNTIINQINKPNFKGCDEIDKVFQFTFQAKNPKQTSDSFSSLDNQNIFIGRKETLQEFVDIVEDCFKKNEIVNVLGVSGAGKTTIARCAAQLLHYNVICVDLRQITNLRELHKLLVDNLFEELERKRITKQAVFVGLNTLIAILSIITDIALVFDHAELLMNHGYEELKNFLPFLNQLRTRVILTSKNSIDCNLTNIREWTLTNPTEKEKIAMLNYWIKTKQIWLESISQQITNHSFLICLIGRKFKGTYKYKKELKGLKEYIAGASDISDFLEKIINELPINIRFWIYLANLCQGSVFSQVIPTLAIDVLYNCGLINEQGESITFHPLIIRNVEIDCSKEKTKEMIIKQLSQIENIKKQSMIEYYKFISFGDDNYIDKSKVLINNWQGWVEEIDSYKTQALISKMMLNYECNSEQVYYDLFLSIIYIFQGKPSDLTNANEKCQQIYSEPNNPLVIRLLAMIESIECQRKQFGPNHSIQLLYNNLDTINEMLNKSISDYYILYGKNYYLGTIFFLVGNILRSMEDNENAVIAYKASQRFINMEDTSLYNASLQKVHIAYGISESYLKVGEWNLAIEFADESLRDYRTSSKFGEALLYLLKARAYLCSVSSKDNFFNESLNSVKKAKYLFESIRLPKYIQRCKLVEGAIYCKTKQIKNAQKTLSELRSELDDDDEMAYRVNILLDYILGKKSSASASQIIKIKNRKGTRIGGFYYMLSDISEKFSFSVKTDSITLKDNELYKCSLSIELSNSDFSLWLVD